MYIDTRLGDQAAIALAGSLPPNLEELIISSTFREGGRAIGTGGMRVKTCISNTHNVIDNVIGDEGVVAIANALPRSLKVLLLMSMYLLIRPMRFC